MKVKTCELIGPALDWAVCQCEHDDLAALNIRFPEQAKHYPKVSPSTVWFQGGPIIKREGISLRSIRKPGHSLDGQWLAKRADTNTGTIVQWVESPFGNKSERGFWRGPSPLIAAMRCHVATKLGDEIEIPNELLNQ